MVATSITSRAWSDWATSSPITRTRGIDWFRVTELTVQCANDQGIAARLIPPGDGISLSDVPTGQHLNARSVLNACRAGLQLPPPEPPTRETIEAEYAHQLEVAECLRGEGYAIPEASSLDAFIEGYATGEIWLPYNYVQTVSPTEWERLQVACPQSRRPGG